MALIKCPECGKEVSDRSDVCVNCGFPIKEQLAEDALRFDIIRLGKTLSMTDEEFEIIVENEKWLLKELLNYNDQDIEHIINVYSNPPGYFNFEYEYSKVIAQNLTAEQTLKIIIPLHTYGSNCVSVSHGSGLNKMVFKKDMPHYDEYKDMVGVKKTHYYDEPIITEDQKPNIYEKIPFKRPQQSVVSNVNENVPKCPTCGSHNINKISGLSKAGSVAMWGIFSRKVHKQWHCNNCGSEW